ncbi:EAL domain-containing protein [Micavibrio aeruginosavorus]|uniref:EAL domain protein n=1 Tax=Micavibrio aeruginosavorus (strain ARL-13) TaxID=856793 RepID=G2KRN1_MICAA|nr:EAL domain-containing protein [Micavibrio aeruginosavorus]AEP09593.1 EAL domain protein [Micavibrio aeruginosavorus ARL-13]
MNKNRTALFQDLIAATRMGLDMKHAAGVVSDDDARIAGTLLSALAAGRYHFIAETWHNNHDEHADLVTYPAELLLRAYTAEGTAIKPLEPITILSQSGLQSNFDQALILAGLDQALAQGLNPVSINTSARNVSNASFWYDVCDMLCDDFTPGEIHGQLTLEVTEDDLADSPCRDILLAMKRQFGCTFAIDDFYHDYVESNGHHGIGSRDWLRLDNLRDIVDYVKIDGVTVEAALDQRNPFNLGDLVDRIKHIVPNVKIVLERVKNADQAHAFNTVSDAVQGLYLTHDRDAFRRELFIAARNFPPRPENL